MDEGRQMVSEDKGKQHLKRQTLEFDVKYGGWQKPEENWSVHIYLRESDQQLGSHRLHPLQGSSFMPLLGFL